MKSFNKRKKSVNIVPFKVMMSNISPNCNKYMALSDLELNYISKYLSTAVNKVRTTMSVVGHHLLLRLFIMNLHIIDFK